MTHEVYPNGIYKICSYLRVNIASPLGRPTVLFGEIITLASFKYKKLKLPHYTPSMRRGGEAVQLYVISTSTLEGDGWTKPVPIVGGWAPGPVWTGGRYLTASGIFSLALLFAASIYDHGYWL
jgi:hypothetical protein